MNTYEQLDAWIDAHFDEQVRFLQELIRVPTDTPPGNNAPHAERTASCCIGFGLDAEKHPVPEAEVKAFGLESVTNLVVRRKYGPGKTVLLNAHGDVVPPGEGWTKNPYGGEIENGKIYGRAAAVSKCDFSTYARLRCAHWKPLPNRRTAAWSCSSPTTKSLVARWGPSGCSNTRSSSPI
jgi:succinyl-diaminopimelate desuccinylase